MYSVPVEFNDGIAMIPLSTSESIENGDLLITANITGANGASNSAQFLTPIVLSPPEILSIDLCQDGEEIQQLMFGQTADAVVRVRSSRQISEVTASLEQFGWIVTAPPQSATSLEMIWLNKMQHSISESNSIHLSYQEMAPLE